MIMGRDIAVPDLSRRILLNDLEKEILRIDRKVLGVSGHAEPKILHVDDGGRALYHGRGLHIGSLVSYIPLEQFPPHKKMAQKLVQLHRWVETYALWFEPIGLWIDAVLIGGKFPRGEGHAAIRRRWFLLACALVR